MREFSERDLAYGLSAFYIFGTILLILDDEVT